MCLILIKINKNLLFLPFIFITLFSGLRKNVGIDFIIYEDLYSWSVENIQATAEPFFKYIPILVNLLGGNFQFFLLLSATLSSFFVYKFIEEKSQHYILSFLIYFCIISFYLFSMNAVRQCIASSIFLYSLIYLEKKKIYIYIILNLIGTLFFHMSLLFIFPLAFFTIYNLNSRIRLFGYIIAFLVGIFSNFIASISIYSVYENIEIDSQIGLKTYLFFFITVILEFKREKYKNKELWSQMLVNLNYLSLLILIILLLQDQPTMILNFKRIHNYFFLVYIVYIPYIILFFKSISFKRIILIFFYFLLPILFLTTIYFNGEKTELIPYKMDIKIFK